MLLKLTRMGHPPGEGRDVHNVMSKIRSDGELRGQQGGQTEHLLNKREFSTSQKIWKFTVVCSTSVKESNSDRSIDKPFRHHYKQVAVANLQSGCEWAQAGSWQPALSCFYFRMRHFTVSWETSANLRQPPAGAAQAAPEASMSSLGPRASF